MNSEHRFVRDAILEWDMTQTSKESEADNRDESGVSWGPKLFFGVLVAVLVFLYWLLIYSGGVTVHHG